jgi:hypothetical protein
MQLSSKNSVLYFIDKNGENEEAKTMCELKKRLKAEPAGTYTVYQRCGPEHRRHPNCLRIINRFIVTDGKVAPAPRPSDVHAVGWLRNGS